MGKGSSPKIKAQEPIEEVEVIKEDEVSAQKRERRRQVLSGGRRSTILSGITTELGQRLG